MAAQKSFSFSCPASCKFGNELMYSHMGISDDDSKNEIKRARIRKSSSALPSQTSLAFCESLTMPLVQEVILSADVRCKECQKRITRVLSRLNAETESVVVNVLEKKVTVICKYPSVKETAAPSKQITTTYKNRLAKFALLRMIFFSSSSSSY